MNLSYTSEIHEGYVKLVLTGEWELIEILKMIGVVRAESEAAHRDRVLVDVRDVGGQIPDVERFETGKQVALALGPSVKVAVIGRPERINRVTENAAIQRGGRMLVASTEEDALAWLLA
jgi:hypothetical protein